MSDEPGMSKMQIRSSTAKQIEERKFIFRSSTAKQIEERKFIFRSRNVHWNGGETVSMGKNIIK